MYSWSDRSEYGTDISRLHSLKWLILASLQDSSASKNLLGGTDCLDVSQMKRLQAV
jgi:hypothetical protein